MSALPPKADIVQHGGNVRFVPKADSAPQQKRQSFLSNAFKEIAPFRAELPSPTASHKADPPIQP
jgi:hypothetical protein